MSSLSTQEQSDAEKTSYSTISRLKQARESHGWSQADLAERIGTNQVSISRWEKMTTRPSPYFRQKLAETLGKSVEELGLATEVAADIHDIMVGNEFPTIPATPAPLSLPSHWHVPYLRNPFFTGREDVLTRLHDALMSARTAALTQAQAISGLGGIGKTQIAVEYAYRYQEYYSAVLWVNASSREILFEEFVTLAALLDLPEKTEPDQNIVFAAIHRWLTAHPNWLLILDNADDLQAINDILPRQGAGCVLITTRLQALGGVAQSIEVHTMEPDEGILFLLRRTKLLTPQMSLAQVDQLTQDQGARIVAELASLPLALDQAGAYIEETNSTLASYITLYRTHQKVLLSRRGQSAVDHPEPVATTWEISFQEIQKANPAAAELLYLLAFFNVDAIPEEILADGADELGPTLRTVANDQLGRDEIIGLLRRYSLIQRNAVERLLNIHRLVQSVLRVSLDKEQSRLWAERAIRALNCTFPEVEFNTWTRCRRCLPHALASLVLLEEFDLAFLEASDLLIRAANYLVSQAQFVQAEPMLKKALAIDERVLDEGDTRRALALNDLGMLYHTQGRYAEAEPLLRQAMEIRHQQLGDSHGDTAASLTNMARLYHAQGRYNEAERLYQQASQMLDHIFEPWYIDKARVLNFLAELYMDQGKYDEAEALYQQALDIEQRALGVDHPDVVRTQNNLAHVYRKKGQYRQAEVLYQEALQRQKELLGPEHVDVAQTIMNLGRLYRAQGKYDKAEALYREALSILLNVLDPNHPQIAQTLYSMMKLYHSQGKYPDAEQVGMQALKMQEQRLGPEHPDIANTLSMLARIYHGQRRFVETEQLYKRAIAIRERSGGGNHPHMALIKNNLAELYQAQGRYAEAKPLIEESMNIRRLSLGDDHLYMAYSHIILAENLAHFGIDEEAKYHFQTAIAIREHLLGEDHPRTATAYHLLAIFYNRRERYDQAEGFFKKALTIRENKLGPMHPSVAATSQHYASLLRATGRETDARKLESRAKDIQAKQSQDGGP